MNKKTSYLFTLEGINPAELDNKYNLTMENEKITSISSLDEMDKSDFCPFIDKRYANIIVNMVDSICKKSISKNINCYWCRNPFDTIPIGCPLKFVSNRIRKTFSSHITREKYDIIQNMIYPDKVEGVEGEEGRGDERGGEGMNKQPSYYETEGCFCSFNCCMAWIKENEKNIKYINSEFLLKKMYLEIFGINKIQEIRKAPSWKLLKEYGGTMTIEEFRNSFQKVVYNDLQNTFRKLPNIEPVGELYEKYKFF